MDQPRSTTHVHAQEETARYSTTPESSEDQFYAQLSRGASSLMLRPSSSLDPLGHSTACNEQQELNKAKEASKEEEEEEEEDTDVEEFQSSREVDKGKEDEEEEEAVEEDPEEAKRKADQMRRDEELARQLQIQFLREVGGADPELLQQLNALVQQEASAALNESSPVVLDNVSDAAELVECAICCEEKKLQEIYTYYQCGHRYCVDCLKEYYATHILEGDVKLRCPYPGCSTAVLPVQVAAVVDSQLLQKYKQFAWYDEVKTNPNTRWCTKPGCETVLVRPDGGEPKVVCSGCGTVTCFLCGDEWHEGASCEDNRKRKIEAGLADTTVEDYVKKQNVNVRICPRCAVPIEKNKGCNTMTCSFCGCSFCWLCGQVMTPHHFSQKGPCKGKDGEAKWLKALVYTILAGMIVTLPVWAGPAYVVYKVKQHKRKRLARAAEAAEAAASAPAQNS